MKYCRIHKSKKQEQHHLIDDESFNLKAQIYWNEALELESKDKVPIASLNDIFYYIKEAFEHYDDNIVSIRRLQKWYRNTQSEEHPVWIIDHNYTHLTAMPYREILEDKNLEVPFLDSK